MHTIEIDDQVFHELEKKVQSFNDSPNKVLRRMLSLSLDAGVDAMTTSRLSSPLGNFLNSSDFRSLTMAVDKFKALLSFLYRSNSQVFQKFDGFRIGTRVYLSKSRDGIEATGKGIAAQLIPNTEFWVLTTIDNKTKRNILQKIMPHFGYNQDEIRLAMSAIPDSGMTRSRTNLVEYL